MRFVSKYSSVKEYAETFTPWLLVVGVFLFTYVVYYFLNENNNYGREESSRKERKDKITKTLSMIEEFSRSESIASLQEKYTYLDKEKLIYSLRKAKCDHLKAVSQKENIDCNNIDLKALHNIKISKEDSRILQKTYQKIEAEIFSYFDDNNKKEVSKILRFYRRVVDCVETEMCSKPKAVEFFSGYMVSFVTWFCPYYERIAIDTNSPLLREDDRLVRFISKNKQDIPETVHAVRKDADGNRFFFRCKAHIKIEKELLKDK